MCKDPAFLFYSSDFLTGTMFMTNEQVGIYVRLLCAQHQHGHLSEKHMLFMCSGRDVDIFEKFEKDEQGLYYNDRLDRESDKRKSYSESRRINASARKTAGKTPKAYADHMENENDNENRDIIDYLNSKTGKKYRCNVAKTKSVIGARIKEGFTVCDFKEVINNKCADWLGNADYEKFLRPETLFGNKFEGYLNQKCATKQSTITETSKGVFKI